MTSIDYYPTPIASSSGELVVSLIAAIIVFLMLMAARGGERK